MAVDKPDYQFPEQLTLIDIEESTSTELTMADARMRNEASRSALDGRTDVEWIKEYWNLRDGGWNWRVAAYIAWASSPKVARTPKTQEELARNFLGLTSDRQIIKWRKRNPVIDETVSMLQSSRLWDARADVFDALIRNAADADYKTHNDRKLFLELTGDYVPSAKLAAMITKNGFSKNELADMSDAELLQLAKNMRDEVTKDTAAEE